MSKPRRERRTVDGILLLDKPSGISSNGALQHVKRLYRAAKAGHTGSLDPLATGLLPICLGQATKLTTYLLESDKCYRVRARMGARSASGDAEGEIVERTDRVADDAALRAALPRFLGEIQQTPPMYSALKHEGRRLYALARAGQEVERPARPVRIHDLRLLGSTPDEFELDVHCSKGTYVRVLVEDLARAAGTLAYVTALRRTALAPFDGDSMVSPRQLESAAEQGLQALDALLLSPAQAFEHWPQVSVDEDRAFYLSRGQAVRVAGAPLGGQLAVFGPGRRLLGIAEIDADGMVAPRRWMSAAAS